MSARFEIGDRVWFQGRGWQIINLMVGPTELWRETPMYLGRNITTGAEIWIHENDIGKKMTEEEAVGEVLGGEMNSIGGITSDE